MRSPARASPRCHSRSKPITEPAAKATLSGCSIQRFLGACCSLRHSASHTLPPYSGAESRWLCVSFQHEQISIACRREFTVVSRLPDSLPNSDVPGTLQRTGRGSEEVAPTDVKSNKSHASTTIIERIVNTRRGYLAWLAAQTATIAGKESAIDSEADASWRAR